MQYDTYIHTKIHQMKLKHKQYNKQLVLTKRVNDNLLIPAISKMAIPIIDASLLG